MYARLRSCRFLLTKGPRPSRTDGRALSQQLAELRKAGMVKTRRASRSIFDPIADARAQAILEMLRIIFCDDAQEVAKPPITAARTVPLGQKVGDTAQFARVD
jgi:hypothetical protein